MLLITLLFTAFIGIPLSRLPDPDFGPTHHSQTHCPAIHLDLTASFVNLNLDFLSSSTLSRFQSTPTLSIVDALSPVTWAHPLLFPACHRKLHPVIGISRRLCSKRAASPISETRRAKSSLFRHSTGHHGGSQRRCCEQWYVHISHGATSSTSFRSSQANSNVCSYHQAHC